MADLKETRAGLPNTCSECGKDVGPSWFAPNDDAAAAGGGVCTECAGQKQTFAPIAGPNSEVEQLAQNIVNVVRDAQGVSNERVLRPAQATRNEAEAQADRNQSRVSPSDRQAPDALKGKR
jgi:hypothetical protein